MVIDSANNNSDCGSSGSDSSGRSQKVHYSSNAISSCSRQIVLIKIAASEGQKVVVCRTR